MPPWAFTSEHVSGTVYSTMESNETWMVRCKRLYEERGLTQEQFAELIPIGQSGMSRWINGKRRPSMAKFARMAAVLSATGAPVSAAYLMWGDPTREEIAESVRRALEPPATKTPPGSDD